MLALPAPELVSVNIPFDGFYNSRWSDLIDTEETQFLEHVEEEPDRYDPEMVLVSKRGELADLLWKHTSYRTAYVNIAKDYAEAYLWRLAEELGFPVTVIETPYESTVTPGYTWVSRIPVMPVAWEFEELNSPREYNFVTDRIFAKVDAVLLRELHRQLMLVDNSWAFDRTVKEMFTSYDGFCSFYDNDPLALKDKPLDEWDHNELKVLFNAWEYATHKGRGEGTDWAIYYGLAEGSYSYFDDALDWGGLKEACREMALEWLDEEDLTEDEHYRLEHPRCTETLELPL